MMKKKENIYDSYISHKENIYDSYISHKENILFTLKINKFAR